MTDWRDNLPHQAVVDRLFTEPMLMAATNGNHDLVALYSIPLDSAGRRFDIVTPPRRAMFLAQVAHESGGLLYTEEIWGPTETQLRYEGRLDLGNTVSGDGSKFRGHGLIQITGRANHLACAEFFDLQGFGPTALINWMRSPQGASLSAAWFWMKHGCNEIADSGDFVALTRRINGRMNGYLQRQDYLARITAAM